MKTLIKEINNEFVNVKYFKIDATNTALRAGYLNCIEKVYIYKENNSVTITRHLSDTIENIVEQDDTYFKTFNGERISVAKN
jgi:hypothetical protein